MTDARPDAIDDIILIRQLLARYNLSGDRLRLDELAATFAPDGVLDTGGAVLEGRAGIAAGLAGVGGGKDAKPAPAGAVPLTLVRHHLTTSHVEMTGPDSATGRSYFHVYTDIGPDHMGVYVDRYVKTDGRWLIAHRRVQTDWVADNSLFPGALDAYRERLARKRGVA